MSRSFCALILTYRRPDRVRTYETLRRCGYSGPIFLVVDDGDESLEDYRSRYGDEVVTFSKQAVAAETDAFDNHARLDSVLYARNAAHSIAESKGATHFVQLDDDYTDFYHRVDGERRYISARRVTQLDSVFEAMLDFLDATPAVAVAMPQGGDLLSGKDSPALRRLGRKCMNSFFCRVDRPFRFFGRMNDDVNTYCLRGSRGDLMLTAGSVHLNQGTTQAHAGGLTEMYLDSGTYVKSFYTVMACPSFVHVGSCGSTQPRLHHRINWGAAVPKIVREDQRKP